MGVYSKIKRLFTARTNQADTRYKEAYLKGYDNGYTWGKADALNKPVEADTTVSTAAKYYPGTKVKVIMNATEEL